MACIKHLRNILCVSEFCLLTQPGLVPNLVCGTLFYSSFIFLFSSIKVQAGIDEGSGAFKMQITHATDKKSIWMVRSGSGSFAHNKLNRSEYNFFCAEGYISKQYTEREFFLLLWSFFYSFLGGIGGFFLLVCFGHFLFWFGFCFIVVF